MLGAAVSAPIQKPTQGLLLAAVILGTVAALQRGLSVWSFRRRGVELAVHGDAQVLVVDGRLVVPRVPATKMSRDMELSKLRAHRVWQLGEVQRIYLEPAGDLSTIRYAHPRPGLSLSPDGDGEDWPAAAVDDCSVCGTCGAEWAPVQRMCPWCQKEGRVPACRVPDTRGSLNWLSAI